MSERPFMQLYVSDFIGDTLQLSTEQLGAYMLLLMAMWNAGGSLPAEEAKLARVARMSVKKWKSVSCDIMAFFEIEEGSIKHKRLTKELQKSDSKSQSRASAGAEGGRAKALKDKNARLANATSVPWHLPDTRDHIEAAPSGAAARLHELDPHSLESRLRDAAGEKIQPSGGFVIGPIMALLNAGVDLEMDILPTIRSRSFALTRPARSWDYFVPAIQDAYDKRRSAGTWEHAAPSTKAQPPPKLTPHQQRHKAAVDAFERRKGEPDDEFAGTTIDLADGGFGAH